MSWQKKETSKLENRSTDISQSEKQNGKEKKKKKKNRSETQKPVRHH